MLKKRDEVKEKLVFEVLNWIYFPNLIFRSKISAPLQNGTEIGKIFAAGFPQKGWFRLIPNLIVWELNNYLLTRLRLRPMI